MCALCCTSSVCLLGYLAYAITQESYGLIAIHSAVLFHAASCSLSCCCSCIILFAIPPAALFIQKFNCISVYNAASQQSCVPRCLFTRCGFLVWASRLRQPQLCHCCVTEWTDLCCIWQLQRTCKASWVWVPANS